MPGIVRPAESASPNGDPALTDRAMPVGGATRLVAGMLPDTAPVIEVAGLHKRYGTTVAVDDVSFIVHPGEVFGLAGTGRPARGLPAPGNGHRRLAERRLASARAKAAMEDEPAARAVRAIVEETHAVAAGAAAAVSGG